MKALSKSRFGWVSAQPPPNKTSLHVRPDAATCYYAAGIVQGLSRAAPSAPGRVYTEI